MKADVSMVCGVSRNERRACGKEGRKVVKCPDNAQRKCSEGSLGVLHTSPVPTPCLNYSVSRSRGTAYLSSVAQSRVSFQHFSIAMLFLVCFKSNIFTTFFTSKLCSPGVLLWFSSLLYYFRYVFEALCWFKLYQSPACFCLDPDGDTYELLRAYLVGAALVLKGEHLSACLALV